MFHRSRPGAASVARAVFVSGLPAALAVLCVATWAAAHEIWVETAPVGQVGREQEIRVCWGHGGHREGGEGLKGQQSRLTAWIIRPDSPSQPLPLHAAPDCYTAKFTPAAPGDYVVGAESQTGILDHSATTRSGETRAPSGHGPSSASGPDKSEVRY